MENLIVIRESDLRQLIREESLNNPPPMQEVKSNEKPLTTKELCLFLNLSEPTIIKWRARNKIPFLKIGSVYRYDKAAVLKALSDQKKGGSRK